MLWNSVTYVPKDREITSVLEPHLQLPLQDLSSSLPAFQVRVLGQCERQVL